MANFIKNIIIRLCNFLGYRLKGNRELVKHNSFNAIHKFLFNDLLKKDKIIIFDIGANDGSSIKRFQKRFPGSNIYSFEPTEFLFNKIKANVRSDEIKIYNKAVGDIDGQKDFFQYGYHEVNSFYPMIENSKYKYQRTKNEEDREKVSKVEVTTLDTFVKKNKITEIDLLKIDTQGSEADVLKGAESLLNSKKINVIELEHIIGIAHDLENSFFRLEELLVKNDYKLIAIENADNIISFSNFQTDLIYVKKSIFKEIENFHKNNRDVKNVTHKVKHYEKI